MKKIALLIFSIAFISACKDKSNEPNKSPQELISQNAWALDRYTSETGQPIASSQLNTQALLLYAMNFQFLANGEVKGTDKTTKNIIDKGVWKFVNSETMINVKMTGLEYDFRVILLKSGKLTLQAPTGNYLSGIGEQINLVFSPIAL